MNKFEYIELHTLLHAKGLEVNKRTNRVLNLYVHGVGEPNLQKPIPGMSWRCRVGGAATYKGKLFILFLLRTAVCQGLCQMVSKIPTVKKLTPGWETLNKQTYRTGDEVRDEWIGGQVFSNLMDYLERTLLG